MNEEERKRFEESRRQLHTEQQHKPAPQTQKPTWKERAIQFAKGDPNVRARQNQRAKDIAAHAYRAVKSAAVGNEEAVSEKYRVIDKETGKVTEKTRWKLVKHSGAAGFAREEAKKRYIDYEKGRTQRLNAKRSKKGWSPGYQRKAPSRNPTTMQSFGMDMNVFEPDRGNRPERVHEPKSGLVNILADHSSGGMLENGGMGSDRKQKKSFLESW